MRCPGAHAIGGTAGKIRENPVFSLWLTLACEGCGGCSRGYFVDTLGPLERAS